MNIASFPQATSARSSAPSQRERQQLHADLINRFSDSFVSVSTIPSQPNLSTVCCMGDDDVARIFGELSQGNQTRPDPQDDQHPIIAYKHKGKTFDVQVMTEGESMMRALHARG